MSMATRGLLNRLLLRLTAGLPVREIRLDGVPYMERHFVCRVGSVTAYLHRYRGADGDRHVHDHPWTWALGIPLTGGYDEEHVVGLCPRLGWLSVCKRIRPWRWNFIGARTFHRVASVQPQTWTLFVHGARFKGWGFLTKQKDFDELGGDVLVVYDQPEDVSATKDWHLHAPRAAQLRAAS